MKQAMSSVDVAAAMLELQSLIGAGIDKAYQHTRDEIRLQLYLRGETRERIDLVIEAGRRLHLTKYPRESPKTPSSFAMLLRKYISGGRITEIRQHDFDRIVEIAIERGESKNFLIAELFSKGNVILLDGERKIILPLHSLSFHDREIRGGEQYEYPPPQVNPVSIQRSELEQLLGQSEKGLVRGIATRLNLGGLYAEEICLRAKVDKNAKKLESAEMNRIYSAMQELFTPLLKGKLKPHIVIKDGEEIDALPFELQQYEGYERKFQPAFNAALDKYFSKLAVKKIEVESDKAKEERLSVFTRMLEQQEDAVRKLVEEEEEYFAKGELIYSSYEKIEKLLGEIRELRKKKIPWKEIHGKYDQIKSIDEARGAITIELDGKNITLNIGSTLPQNASKYYEQAKKVREKREGAEAAIIETKKKIEKEKARKVEVKVDLAPRRRIRRKEHWYDRFRWFISSDGFLVAGGRDAETNEELVKKYMQSEDIFFHAQAHGAPVVIIKTEGKEVPVSTLREAAVFAVSYSNVWKAKQFAGDCYWVKPGQVSKTPESGEYIAKGAFVIRGERNYFHDVAAGIAIGVEINEETRVIAGPKSAITKSSKYHAGLVPGDIEQNEAAKKIAAKLLEIASEEDKRIIKTIAGAGELARFLPPGEADIIEVKRSGAL